MILAFAKGHLVEMSLNMLNDQSLVNALCLHIISTHGFHIDIFHYQKTLTGPPQCFRTSSSPKGWDPKFRDAHHERMENTMLVRRIT